MKSSKKLNGMAGLKQKRKSAFKTFAGIVLMVIMFFGVSALTNDVGTGMVTAVGLFGLSAIQRDSVEAGSVEQKALLDKIKTMIDEGVSPTSKELKEFKKQLDELEKTAKESRTPEKYDDVLKEHAQLMIDVNALKEKKSSQEDVIPNLRGQIKSWVEANKTAIANIKGGQEDKLTPLTIKVASPMTPANTYNGSAYIPQPEFSPGATEIVRVQPTFWDYLKKGRTTSAAYVWVNKKNPLGAAGFIGPGVAKPGVSFELATEISNAKKVAVSEKCATELLEDIDGMASWIEMELAYQLKQKVNATLMTGTSSSTVPAGIQTISVAYSLTTVQTITPNNWDAIRACVAQLRSGNLQGVVTTFMNPIDYANMVLTKAISQGQYVNNPPETGSIIVEDNNIPVGYIQVALLDYYKVLIYKDFQVSYGWENDDFTKNLVTTIGEMRLHQFFSENHTGAFIYDSLSNIKTAITTV